jgi:undecaprenyl-diphosphatase
LASKRSIATMVLLLISFFAVGILVRYSFLQPLDVRVSTELQETSGAPLDQIMLAATFLGSTVVVCSLAAVIALLLAKKKHGRAGWFVLFSLLSIPLDMVLKQIWARARPDQNIVHVVVQRVGFSFPSGHALVGTSFYGCLAVLAWVHLRDHAVRKPLVIGLGALPILIDVSRVYLGAHWLSDVIGGTTVGLILLVVLTSWYRHDKQQVSAPINLKDVKPDPQ